jgi:hypothetical protein
MRKIVYIADISQDIDDLMAILYLQDRSRLECVVLDGKSRDAEREKILTDLNIPIFEEIPEGTKVVFCGGSFAPIAKYLRAGNRLNQIVANGFFAGYNIVPSEHVLPKFKNQLTCRSYNPGLDPESARFVLTRGIETLIVSKNVCHHKDNIMGKWHPEIFDCRPTKLLHDVLMVKEGLRLLDGEKLLCYYKPVNIYHEDGKWGSTELERSNIWISVYYKG